MILTVLGSAAFIPTVKRGNPGFWVEVGSKNILMDIGPGTVRQIAKAGKDYKKINILIINHLDADHVNDLFSLIQLYNSNFGFTGQKELVIIAGAGFKKFLTDIAAVYPDAKAKPGILKLNIIEGGNTKFNGFTIETIPGKHTDSSIFIKIKEGTKELVYTGDTIFDEQIKQFTHNPELFITECTKREGVKDAGSHLTPSLAAKMANLVGAKRLLLVHFGPEINPADIVWEVPKYYRGKLIIAEDFLKVQF